MHQNEELIEIFYTSFQKLDAEAMARCYHPDIRFSDPVFLNLSSSEVDAMWRMLCSQAKNFEVTFADVQANEQMGKAHEFHVSCLARYHDGRIRARGKQKKSSRRKFAEAIDREIFVGETGYASYSAGVCGSCT